MLPHDLHTLQEVFLFLLLLVAVFAVVAARFKVPYPIVLVLVGLAVSFIPHVPRVPLSPDFVFLIFLPPLLYASAWQTNLREFKANLTSISLLAVGLVGFTVWGVAQIADHFITALDWKTGFLLGAVVATTDAVAATAIARSIGLPQRIVDLLEGESLINDATGLLALEFGLIMLLRGQDPTPGAALLRMLWLIAGGVGVGLLLGAVTAWIERWVDDGPVEMVISLIVPYTAYLAGEAIDASGVLAVVACGLYLSRRSVAFFSPQTRIQLLGSWNALNFTLNGLIFLLMGLQLPYILAGIGQYSHLTLLLYSLVFSAALILLRLIWVFPAAGLAHAIQTRLFKQKVAPLTPQGVFVVGWTGMRGVIALAAAISIPETLGNGQPFQQRNLIIFLTFAIILVTLVVQGLTLPPLIRLLGLARNPHAAPEESEEEQKARRIVLEAALAFLERKKLASPDSRDTHSYDDLIHRYSHRLTAVGHTHREPAEAERIATAVQRHRQITLETLAIERGALNTLRDTGTIGDDVQRRLERELDLTEARLLDPS